MSGNATDKKNSPLIWGMMILLFVMMCIIIFWLGYGALVGDKNNREQEHDAVALRVTPEPRVNQTPETVENWTLTNVIFGEDILQQTSSQLQRFDACIAPRKVIQTCTVTTGDRLTYSSELAAALGDGVLPAEVTVDAFVEHQLMSSTGSTQTQELEVPLGHIFTVTIKNYLVINPMTGTLVSNLNKVLTGQIDYRTGGCAVVFETIVDEVCSADVQATSIPTNTPETVVQPRSTPASTETVEHTSLVRTIEKNPGDGSGEFVVKIEQNQVGVAYGRSIVWETMHESAGLYGCNLVVLLPGVFIISLTDAQIDIYDIDLSVSRSNLVNQLVDVTDCSPVNNTIQYWPKS